MSKVKSEKAKKYAESAAFSPGGISYTLTYGDAYDGFIAGHEAAETEAEERHAKELQELKDKAVETFRRCCKYKHDWFCSDLDNRTENGECDSNCNYMQNFTQKLNEL